MTTPVTVYDRVPLRYFGKNIVMEYIDGYCEVHEKWMDEWRLIDLDTGEVFEKDTLPHTILHAACGMMHPYSEEKSSENMGFVYIPEREPKPKLRKFDDIPLKDKLRHIQSHAQDLEHDFKLDGNGQCPLDAALSDYQMRYNDKPCFYKDEDGKWELCDF